MRYNTPGKKALEQHPKPFGAPMATLVFACRNGIDHLACAHLRRHASSLVVVHTALRFAFAGHGHFAELGAGESGAN